MRKILNLAISSILILLLFSESNNAFANDVKKDLNFTFAATSSNIFVIKSDGSVWGWGRNNNGQLGNDIKDSSKTPVKLTALNDVIDFAAGNWHILALKKDGTVWACGLNDVGQLGNKEITKDTWKRWGKDFTDATAIAASEKNSYVLKSDGTVWSSGNNFFGQLGYGDDILPFGEMPGIVAGLTDVKSISAGSTFAIALKKDGTVWAWGDYDSTQRGGDTFFTRYGQVGDYYYSYSKKVNYKNRPVQIDGLKDIISISAGAYHSLALKKDGTVWAWGGNKNGQLGNGMYRSDRQAYQVQELTDIIEVATGYNHSVALKNDGTVWAWGGNDVGQLGDGTKIEKTKPIQVKDLSGVVKIAAAGDNNQSFYTTVIKDDGTIWAWGNNVYGQLGDISRSGTSVPAQVKDMLVFSQEADKEIKPDISNININGVSAWAEIAVKTIKFYNLADNDFFTRLNQPIKRSEFSVLAIKMYEKALNCKLKVPVSYYFTDIADSTYKDYIQQAYELGIVSGFGKYYKPDNYITRQEISVILLNLMKAIDSNTDYISKDDINFVDDTDISPWARNAIIYVYKNNIMTGTGILRYSQDFSFGKYNNGTVVSINV